MRDRLVSEIGNRQGIIAGHRQLQRDLFQELPDVPVLPETLLLLDLKMREPRVNMRVLSQAVLSDLGAALQVFRAAGEGADPELRAGRIEDCIRGLNLEGLLETMASPTVRYAARRRGILEAWSHARRIATYCRLMTEDFAPGIAPDLSPDITPDMTPDQAYLVGLFHELGWLPALLGWSQTAPNAGEPAAAGLRIAEEWSLPRCVRAYFREQQAPGPMNHWTAIVHTAHELASMPWIESCFSAGIGVQAPARA
ncbi:MAG TPA: hypothetical protein VE291_01620 [Terracidiphilus sp.]|jgi:hypothetical protein|nr:hypothetical protein [Terracidiphilus sp.]